jgi:hypothetical protein
MEEKKEWHIMRAEPVKETTVEIPNLWGLNLPPYA